MRIDRRRVLLAKNHTGIRHEVQQLNASKSVFFGSIFDVNSMQDKMPTDNAVPLL